MRRSLVPKNYTPRLACVKPAASVHPEPGSNSSSYILICSIQVASLSIIIEKSYSLFFSNLYRYKFVLSIQYVYERVIAFLIHLSLKAGAKVQYLFNLARLSTLFFKSLSLLILHLSLNP